MSVRHTCTLFFFFNDTATTEIYTLSLHDALPIFHNVHEKQKQAFRRPSMWQVAASSDSTFLSLRSPLCAKHSAPPKKRSEEHTSELQSQSNLVCRLLLEKKKNIVPHTMHEAPLCT